MQDEAALTQPAPKLSKTSL